MNIVMNPDLSPDQKSALANYLKKSPARMQPYHLLSFQRLNDSLFRYPNFSMVAFDEKGEVQGYLPQWKKSDVLDSVPWRDKGGPLFDNDEVLAAFVAKSKEIVQKEKLRGFIWKDFSNSSLPQHAYFVNVEVDLKKLSEEDYWKKLKSEARNRIRNGEKAGLKFVVIDRKPSESELRGFYRTFTETRRRLGVPAYPPKFFNAYFDLYLPENIRLLNVFQGDELLSSLILLMTDKRAVHAFSCSTSKGQSLNANDFMFFHAIKYCREQGMEIFDFGADSPLQKSLIKFKLKWLGEDRVIKTTIFGKVTEQDHNRPEYKLARTVIRKLPKWLYNLLSRWVVGI